MRNKLKKIGAIGLSVTTAMWLSGAVMVLPAQAATAADVQAQINALLAQIQALQSQLGTSQASGASSATTSYNYTRDLTLGSKGADVTALQNFLISQNSAQWPSGQTATGYFGKVTKSAMSRYQAAVGVSPASGYFGPKTRAYVASLAATGTTGTAGTTGTTGTAGTTTTKATTVVPGTTLLVALSADNPPAGSLISSSGSAAARVPMLGVTFTAGTGSAITVAEIKFRKVGVLSDSSVSSAYLIEKGKVVGQYSSLSSGVLAFSSLALNFAAGQSRTLWLAIDPATGLSAGNTVSFQLASDKDITTFDAQNNAIVETGTFPVNGNVFTVTSVSNPSIASVTFASSSVGTSVYAGTTGVLVSAWTVTANNNPVNLTSLNYRVIGSAAKTDIRNVKLMLNGTQIGQSLPTVSSDGTAYFDLTASPARMQTGNSNLQVIADVMGSPNYNFQFELLNSYDVYAVDTQYNVPVSVTINGGTGTQVTINQGSITVTASSDTPTGNIASGASGVTFGKFAIYAAGEPVKVKFLDAKFTTNASTTGDWPVQLQNVYLVDDQGVQIGTTINTIVSGTSSGQCTLASTTATCHFGTTSSNINYIIPANTTRYIYVRADTLSTAAGWTSITASLPGNTSNLQGQISAQTASGGSATGAALTLVSSPLTAASSGAVGTQTFAKGTPSALIGSYILTAAAAEGINVSNLTVTLSASSTSFQNLLVKVSGTQFGTTKSTLSGSDVVTFSGASPITIPVGGSVALNVYADILNSASSGNYSALTTLTSCSGNGATTFSSRTCSPTSVSGQTVTVSSGPTVTASLSSATAPNQQVVMGATGVALATFRLNDTANVEPVKFTTLAVIVSSTNYAASSSPSFGNLKLMYGATQVAGPVSASSTGSGATAGTWALLFNFATVPGLQIPGLQPGVVGVPQNGALELQVVGDISSFTSGGAVDNGNYVLKFASSTISANNPDITAFGQSSNTQLTSSTVTLNPSQAAGVIGNTITVLRTKLTLSGVAITGGGSSTGCGSSYTTGGATSGRSRVAVDNIACLSFSADPAYYATVTTINLKFSGLAVSTAGATFTVDLIDPSTGSGWSQTGSGYTQATCTPTGIGSNASCAVSFSWGGANIPIISAGSSKSVIIRSNSQSFQAPSTNNQGPFGLSILVTNTTDLSWGDVTTTNGLNLLSTQVPLTIANVSY